MWTFAHPTECIAPGKTLRIIIPMSAAIHWTSDGWRTAHDVELRDTAGGCWFADLAAAGVTAGACVDFTPRWGERWEGKNFRTTIEVPAAGK